MTSSSGRARRITLNTFALFSSEILARFFTLLTVFYITRHWSRDYYGQYCIAINWVTIFAAISSLGLGSLATRDVAHDKGLTSFYLRNIIFLRTVLSVLFVAALAVLGPLLGYEPVLRLALVVLGLRLIIDAFSSAFATLLQAYELIALQGIVNLAGAFLRMVGIILVVYFGLSMIGACWIWVGASTFSLFALWRIGWGRGWLAKWNRFHWAEAVQTLKNSIPFAAFGTFQMLYYRVDSVILKSFAGNEAVALYDVAGRLLFVTYMLADHFGVATLPSLSANQDISKDMGRLATRALKALTFVGMPLTVGGVLLSRPLMGLLFGSQYMASGPAFAVLAISLIFYFVMRPCLNLLAVKNPIILTYIFLAIFLANVVMNFLIIPRWGLMGAAVVSTACEVLLAILCGWFTRRFFQTPSKSFYRGMAACFLSSTLMGFGIFMDPRLYWLGLGPLVYGLALFLMGGLDSDDWASIRSILGRKTGNSGSIQ